jgi:hypothetical protein
VFDAPIFFPAPNTLAYSDHLLLQAIGVWPLYALTHDLVFCYNVVLIASLALAALAMHLLARTLTGSEPAAYVAGLIFGFAPYHFTHLLHIQLQALYFLPLSFLFLHRLFVANRWTDTVGLGIVAGLQTISSVYYGLIGAIGLVCAAVLLILLTRRLTDWRLLRRGIAAVALALLIAAPWTIPYLRVANEAGGGRTLYEASNSSAVLSSFLQAPETNLLYGRTGWLRPGGASHLPFKEGPEQGLFLGFVALALAAVGAFAAPRSLRSIAVVYTAIAVAGVVLSLGPNGIRVLYSGLYRVVFGMAAIRATARFSVLTLFGVAVLAALAIRQLEIQRPAARQFIAAVACALICLEYFNGAIAFPPAPSLTSNAGRWLRDQPGHGAVLCTPMGPFATNTPCMLQSLEHGRPIVNGYSGLRPPFFEALLDAAAHLPAPQSLLTLHDLGVEYVVNDGMLPVDPINGEVLVERASFGDQHVYQVMWSPEVEARLTAVTDVPPPAPGPAPFVIGESATYHVFWTSGPMKVSAGEATISIAPPQGDESYRFVVAATTAPWMSRFYEADVKLETTATRRLLPLTYHEAINDGKRLIERQLTFDANRHEVQVVSGGTSIRLPLGDEARDPITALFYLRTLPMEGASHIVLPLNDNGRRMKLDVAVDQLETIAVDGKSWSAWKLEPQLTDRTERRGQLSMATWVSADAHRVPLIVEVTAAFGSARLELARYRDR